MAAHYSNEEKLDMIECYFASQRNSNIALDRYFENYPERQQPNLQYFSKLVRNLLNFGSFEKPRPKSYAKENEVRDNNIQEYFNENPTTSTREADREINVPKSTIHRVLKKSKYRPYKPTIVQGLQEADYPRRITFSNWFINKCHEFPNFYNNVIWTDETRFTNCGVFNRHNHHHWATENPELRAQRRLQTRFGFNVWCGIFGKIAFFLCFFLKHLTQRRFLCVRNNVILKVTENLFVLLRTANSLVIKFVFQEVDLSVPLFLMRPLLVRDIMTCYKIK
jgi:hypothetical protein